MGLKIRAAWLGVGLACLAAFCTPVHADRYGVGDREPEALSAEEQRQLAVLQANKMAEEQRLSEWSKNNPGAYVKDQSPGWLLAMLPILFIVAAVFFGGKRKQP